MLVAVDHDVLRKQVVELHPAALHGKACLFDNVGNEGRDIDALRGEHVGGIVHAVQRGDVLQEGGESLGLCESAFGKLSALFVVYAWGVEYGLGITEDAGYGGFQFVGNVLCQFATHLVLFRGLFATDALIHSMGIAVEQYTKAAHHHYGEEQ